MKQFYRRIFFLLISFILGSGAYAQREKTVPLEVMLKEIQTQYQVSFLYDPTGMAGKSIQWNEDEFPSRVEEALRIVLPQHHFSYSKISDDTYVIVGATDESPVATKYPNGLQASDLTASASENLIAKIIVRGKVTSQHDQSGIPGVNITVKGTTLGTISGADGSFSIEVPSEDAILVFSFIGYQSVEEPVAGRAVVNVALAEDATELGEVVVTALGLEADKRQLAYTVRNVDTDAVVMSGQTNLVSALSAKVPGVQITSTSGAPGASASIRLRGSKSFKGGNSPLFIIDGVPVDNNESGNGSAGVDVSNRVIDFNSLDIESMSVLSGPQATSLYGTRASNGAVVINTKRGKKGAPVITVTSSYTLDNVNKMPARQKLYAQGRPSSGEYTYRGPESGETNSWGPLISTLEFSGADDYHYDKGGNLVATGAGNGTPARAYDPYETVFVTGKTLNNNVSIAGGGENTRYYFSVGKLKQDGFIPNQNFQRTTFKTNIEADLSQRFTIGASVQFSNSGGDRVLRGSNLSGVMTGILRNPNTFDIGNGKKGQAAADDPDTYLLENGEQRAMAYSSSNNNAIYDNPFFSVNRNPWRDDVNRFFGNMHLSYKITPWAKAMYKLGVDHYTDRRNSAHDINSASETTGEVSQSVRTNTDLNSDLMVLINKDLNSDLELSGTIGHNYYATDFNYQTATGTGLSVAGFYNIDNGSTQTASESYSAKKAYGVYADAKLMYKHYLILNLSGRNDWSSTLPENNNSFFYSAASVGVELTQLLKLQSQTLSYAKLRASVGQAGNDPSPYSTDTYYVAADVDGDDLLAGNEFPAFGTTAFEKSSVQGNNHLRAEVTTTYEVGGEFELFNGRIGLDVTYYKSVSKDQIVSVMISAASGSNNYRTNAGEITNHGIEVALKATPIQLNKFTWDANIVFSANRNEVTAVPDDVEDLTLASFTAVSSKIIKGQPYGVLSGTRYARTDDGKLVIGDDGWPEIDSEQGIIGNPNPDWLAGVTNKVTYKNLSLSFLWDIRKGGDLWNGTRGFLNYLGVSKETGQQREITNFVYDGVYENGETNTTPVSFADPANGLTGIRWRKSGSMGVAEDVIEDGSWVRLRNVTLSYTLPKQRVLGLRTDATLALYANNLLLFTHYTGIDPETNLRGTSNDMGWDYFNMPHTKSYGVSLQLTLK